MLRFNVLTSKTNIHVKQHYLDKTQTPLAFKLLKQYSKELSSTPWNSDLQLEVLWLCWGYRPAPGAKIIGPWMATAPAAPCFRVPWHTTLRLGVTGTIFSLNDAGAGEAGNALRCRVARPEYLSKRWHCRGYTLPLAVARCSYNGWTWVNNTMALNLSRGRLAASLCETLGAWRLCKSCSQSLTSRDVSASRWNVREKFTFYNVPAEKWVSSLQLINTLPNPTPWFLQLCTWDHRACKVHSKLQTLIGIFWNILLLFLPLLWTITTCPLWCQHAQLSCCRWRLPNLHAWSHQRWQAGRLQGAWLRRGAWARWHTATGLEDLFSLGGGSEATGDIGSRQCHRKKFPSQTNCFSRTVGSVWKYDMCTI